MSARAALEFYDRCEPKIVKNELEKATEACFGKSSRDTRRPDIILQLKLNGKIIDYLVFEVNYSTDKDYIIQGMNQALHYLYDMRHTGQNYFFKGGLGRGYNAAVLAYRTNTIQENKSVIGRNDLKVKLFQYEDLLEENEILEEFLHSFFEQNK